MEEPPPLGGTGRGAFFVAMTMLSSIIPENPVYPLPP